MRFVRDRSVVVQFFKFCIVGGMNTAIDFAAYLVLSRFVFPEDYVRCKAISYFCATLNSFMLNKHWTFRSRGRIGIEILPFLGAILIAWLVNSLTMYLAVRVMEWHDLTGFVLATGFAAVANFQVQRNIAFRGGSSVEESNEK